MKIFPDSIPDPAPADIIAWADSSGIKVDGHSFDSTRTPQLIEPMRFANDPDIRIGTFIKPVQSGGSTVAEIIAAFWSAFCRGLIQFNWQDDEKAKERWQRRISKTLRSINQYLQWAGDRFDETICCARFVSSELFVQGVFASGSLDSETVPYQINEEVHLWAPGMLDKARRRQTLVWNSKGLDVSNASVEGDQLHAAYEEGTMEVWETFCPGCKKFHEMRFRWDDKHPELGGLRFDTSAGRVPGGKYNFNRLVPTIRYQMPCGFIMRDNASERRQPGQYRATNEGALTYKRSWTYEGVSVPEIKWPELVSEYLKAVRAMKSGDIEPFKKFVQERECKFYSSERRPFQGAIVLTSAARLNRKGLDGELCKIWAADWQQGYKAVGELTHYWLVIESVLPNCSSQVIFAGMVSDEAELLLTLKDHGITDEDGGGLFDGFIDASKNTKHILSFCYRYGINAVVGGAHGKGGFRHPDGSFRFYSPKKFIYTQLGITFQQAQQDHPEWFSFTRDGIRENESCPYILEYDKAGLLKNYFDIQEMKMAVLARNPKATPEDYIERIVPEDIGEDYLHHHEAWEREMKPLPRKMGEVEGFRQVSKKDHTMSCTTYIDLKKEESGLLGKRRAALGISKS